MLDADAPIRIHNQAPPPLVRDVIALPPLAASPVGNTLPLGEGVNEVPVDF